QIHEFMGDYKELIDKEVDGISGYITDLSYLEGQGENTFSYIRPITYGIDFYGDCLFTSEKEIDQDPEKITAFREASLMGWKHAMEDPEKIIDIILRKYNPDTTRRRLLYEYTQMKKLMHTDIVETGHMNPGRWKHISETFQSLGLIRPGFKLHGFLYTDHLDSHRKNTKILLSVISLMLFILLVIVWKKYYTEKRKEAGEISKHRKEIERSEARFRGLIEFGADGILLGSPEGNIIEVNEMACKTIGMDRRQLIGKFVTAVPFTKESLENAPLRFDLLKEGKVVINERDIIRPDGTLLSIEMKTKMMSDGSYQSIFRDITEKKKIEKRLREFNYELEKQVEQRTDQLENMNRELESFAYSVSHDLRAPVRHIIGFTDIFLKEYRSMLDKRAKNIFEKITTSARKMERLINDLLKFSHTGRQEMTRNDVDMDLTVQKVISEYSDCRDHRCVETEIAQLPVVKADKNLMSIVWENLIDNACKYTRKKDVARISIGYKREGLEHIFRIKDNGVGFDPEFSHKLFGVFQRLHLDKDFPGTGIGLANVRRIVSRHGGRTWADSEGEGKGATFYFSLPIN
ncbi:MAG: PAS domain S-box protein, partial [Candidatus Delongbacteria bacterium]